MRIERRFTKDGQSAYSDIEFRKATSEIKNPDGSIVFRLAGIDVPVQFSQVAADILAQKYFRKAGVPARLKKVEENSVPSWLWRSVADEEALAELPEDERYGSETDARQVFDRLAGTWTYWGWKGGYFTSEDDARAFMDELAYNARHPSGVLSPNSPAMVQKSPGPDKLGLIGHSGRPPAQAPFLCVDPPITETKLTKSKFVLLNTHARPPCLLQSSRYEDDLVELNERHFMGPVECV